jgi:hypothetical protein
VARALIACAAALAAAGFPAAALAAGDRDQSTDLISTTPDGGLPDGPSTNAVISNDKRFARAIVYQSVATNIVRGDTNGHEDVFLVRREGPVDNSGDEWSAGRTTLVSHGRGGRPANGDSFSPTVDGSFHTKPSCVGFLSDASNLVARDSNGETDAFVAKLNGGAIRRVSLPGGRQSDADTTAIAVSGNCKLVAFVTGGRLYVSVDGGKPKRLEGANAADPSFSTGTRTDLVYGASRGVYLSEGGAGRSELVAPGGRNPVYNDIKRQVVAYERDVAGHTQIGYRDIGRGEQIISAHFGNDGNGDSRDPVIGNAGYYVAFESDASNLGVNALGRTGDINGMPDTYLYTDVRNITLVQSVEHKAVPLPGGGQHPSMSFYANYIVFDSPGPLGALQGPHQIYMRWLGGL